MSLTPITRTPITRLETLKATDPTNATHDLIDLQKYAGKSLPGWNGLGTLAVWRNDPLIAAEIDGAITAAATIAVGNWNGRGRDDFVLGSNGNQTFHGNFGDDTLQGAGGNDSLYGEDRATGQIAGLVCRRGVGRPAFRRCHGRRYGNKPRSGTTRTTVVGRGGRAVCTDRAAAIGILRIRNGGWNAGEARCL